MNIRTSISIIVAFVLFISCTSHPGVLQLRRGEIATNVKLDTLEDLPARRMTIVNVITPLTMDRFATQFAIVRKDMSNNLLVYFVSVGKDMESRLSSRYLSLHKSSERVNWGWFHVEDGHITDSLPGLKRIVDSLEKVDTGVFVKEVNGYLYENLRGKFIKDLNYGQFVTNKPVGYDSLGIGLYQLFGGSLRQISKDPDEMFKQRSGTFFIPHPGYGMIVKFDKFRLLNLVDSAGKAALPPANLELDAVK